MVEDSGCTLCTQPEMRAEIERLQNTVTHLCDSALRYRVGGKKATRLKAEAERLQTEYNELAAAVWACPAEELDSTHAVTMTEAHRAKARRLRVRIVVGDKTAISKELAGRTGLIGKLVNYHGELCVWMQMDEVLPEWARAGNAHHLLVGPEQVELLPTVEGTNAAQAAGKEETNDAASN